MRTTSRHLIDHLHWSEQNGYMNPHTAAAYRAACAKVLSVLGEWEQVDVAALNIEDLITRFRSLSAASFKAESLDAYEHRFRTAVSSFLEYTRSPSTWSPIGRPKTNRPFEDIPETTDSGKNKPSGNFTGALEGPQTSSSLIEYPFPLRENLVVRMKLPRDLSAGEAKRLYGFIKSLAVDSTDGE